MAVKIGSDAKASKEENNVVVEATTTEEVENVTTAEETVVANTTESDSVVPEEVKTVSTEEEIVDRKPVRGNLAGTEVNLLLTGDEVMMPREVYEGIMKTSAPSPVISEDKLYMMVHNKGDMFIFKHIPLTKEDRELIRAINEDRGREVLNAIDFSKITIFNSKEEAVALVNKCSSGMNALVNSTIFKLNSAICCEFNLNTHYSNTLWCDGFIAAIEEEYENNQWTMALPKPTEGDDVGNYNATTSVIDELISKKVEKDIENTAKDISTGSTGGGSGGDGCGVGCAIGIGLGILAVGAALWWGYNNFLGDNISDEPISIPENY